MEWNNLHPNKVRAYCQQERSKFKPQDRYVFDEPHIFLDDLKLRDAIFAYEHWESCGRNVFIATDEITNLLINTSINDIHCSQLKASYEFYYIAFQSPINEFCGYYVSDMGEDGISFSFVKENEIVIHENITSIDCDFSVNDIVNSQEIEKAKCLDYPIGLAINLLLYLSMSNNDVKQEYLYDTPKYLTDRLEKAHTKRKKEVVRQAINQAGYTQVKIVGSSFKSHTNNTSTNTVEPHWRRGHWRNQPIGIGLNDTKLIWIKPTIVNRDRGLPQKGHIYK